MAGVASTARRGGGERLGFFPSAGTPLEMYVCNGCLMVRLFAIARRPQEPEAPDSAG